MTCRSRESYGIKARVLAFARIKLSTATALLVLATSLLVTAPAQAAPGDLDPTFSADGKQTTNFGKEAFASGVALQGDGRIVVAGTAFDTFCEDIWCSTPAEFALARYHADGGLDSSFSGDGKVTTDFGGSDNGAYDVALQPDGKTVAVGHTGLGDFALARYDPDGSLDSSFSDDGKVITDFGGPYYGTDWGAYDIALQLDGKIIAVGRSGAGDVALARYNPDGSLDGSFSGDGKQATDLGGLDYGRAVALQADGKIVVAGSSLVGADGNFAVARYNPDGSLDSSFSDDGTEITDFGERHDAEAVAIQPDGKIVVAGTSDSDNGNFALARYNADGSLDSSFAGDGLQTTNFGHRDYGHTVAVQPDSRIVVAGESAVDFALARYNADGTPDGLFGGDGTQTTDFGLMPFGRLDQAFDLALQSDGKIVAVGGTDGDFGLARYEGGSVPRTAPLNSTAPVISGTATEGQTLTVNAGAWTGTTPIDLGYQWRRCDSAGASCVDIAAATATMYALVAADVGHTIRVREAASNVYGQGSADSAATAVIRANPGAITGTVRNSKTKAKIANALVNCGNGYSAKTASNGQYLIADVASGTYSCTASASGYRPSTKDVTVISGTKFTLDFDLVRVSLTVMRAAVLPRASAHPQRRPHERRMEES